MSGMIGEIWIAPVHHKMKSTALIDRFGAVDQLAAHVRKRFVGA
jgi:hypothetical protein